MALLTNPLFLALALSCVLQAPLAAAGTCPGLWKELSRTDRMEAAARAAGLVYGEPGHDPALRRAVRKGKYVYLDGEGKSVTAPGVLARIRSLQIPPGNKDVWISADPDSHIQATSVDSKGRTQYRYHPKWIRHQSLKKFERMVDFGKALPRIRAAVAADLAKPGLPKEKVMAAVVRLLDKSYIRVGNEEYAKANASFGLTTMRKSHVKVDGPKITFTFRGKSGVHHEQSVDDTEASAVLGKLRQVPGEGLFQYLDEGDEAHAIDSDAVNHYLKEISGGNFTAKDFRTWGGSTMAAKYLLEAGVAADEKTALENTQAAVAFAASKLENSPAVARETYIHPQVLSAYEEGHELFGRKPSPRDPALRPEESLVLELLGP